MNRHYCDKCGRRFESWHDRDIHQIGCQGTVEPVPEPPQPSSQVADSRQGEGFGRWQPIATAPKDGTRVLLWSVYDPVPDYEPARSELADIGYWTAFNGGGWVRSLLGEPTHWMPLPSAPNGDLGSTEPGATRPEGLTPLPHSPSDIHAQLNPSQNERVKELEGLLLRSRDVLNLHAAAETFISEIDAALNQGEKL